MAEQRRARGRPPKAPATKRLIVFRPPELWARLQRAARTTGVDVSALLCDIVERFLKTRRGR